MPKNTTRRMENITKPIEGWHYNLDDLAYKVWELIGGRDAMGNEYDRVTVAYKIARIVGKK